MKSRKRSGMSLLEILIVLSILAILIAIVAPRILGSQQKADIKATQLQIAQIEEALKLYAADNRTFPNTEEGLMALLLPPDDERRARNWDGPYFDGDDVPFDPWGNEFQYEYPPSRNRRDIPDIWSWGPDGLENTDDDIGNFPTDNERRSGSDSRRDRD